MKSYILFPVILAACGGTVAPQSDGAIDDAPNVTVDQVSPDAGTDACIPAKQPCTVETRCQFSADPADSLSCSENMGYTWRPDDASAGIVCTMQACTVGTVCWDNTD